VRIGKIQIRPFRLRSRGSLIAATVLLQAAVIGLGWVASLKVARQDVSARARQRQMDETVRAVDHFNTALSAEVYGPVEYGEGRWPQVQALVEGYKMPGGTVLFLLDQQGRVLCHPMLRSSPNLRRLDYSEQLVTLEGGDRVALGDLKPGCILTGQTDLLNGSACVAMTFNAAANAKVVVYQPLDAMVAAESRLTSGFMLWGGLAGLGVLAVTVLGSVLLVRRYDTILLRSNAQLEAEVERRTQRGLSIRNGMIFGLAKLADYRDTETGRHLERISSYCELLANELMATRPEIDRAWIERLKLASSMHDIGKVGIPDSILLKPGAFTAEERRLMEQHPIIGADTLLAIRQRLGDDELLNMSVQVALSHHERWDGKGYPHGLSFEQIPLSARLVALADMYDALTSRRVYKHAMTHKQALEIIRENGGKRFDPDVADAFVRIEMQFNETREALRPLEEERPPLLEAVEQAERAKRRAA
jgi:response regulator RpfG family c-di-GMP phosphodiesterase